MSTIAKLGCIALAMTSSVMGDDTVNTGAITVEVMGSSGGIKLFGSQEAENFIMIQQNKLQECSRVLATDGSVTYTDVNGGGRSWNLAGSGSWSDFESEKVSDVTTGYHTTFTASNGPKNFQLSVHVSVTEYDVEEPIPCSNCNSSTIGYCQNATDQTCSDVNATSGLCDSDNQLCTETVTIREETLKFSTVVSGWTFANTGNFLCYGIDLKYKDGEEVKSDDADSEFNGKRLSAGEGFIDMPTNGKLIGPTGSQDVTIDIINGVKGSKYEIMYAFPNMGTGESFYYDPTMGVSSAARVAGSALAAFAAIASILSVAM